MLSIVDFNVKQEYTSVKFKDVAEFKSIHNWQEFSLFVLGSHSDSFKKQLDSGLSVLHRRYDKRLVLGRIDAFDIENAIYDLSLSLKVIGWIGIKDEFTKERMLSILKMNDNLRKQVVAFSGTLNNYLITE